MAMPYLRGGGTVVVAAQPAALARPMAVAVPSTVSDSLMGQLNAPKEESSPLAALATACEGTSRMDCDESETAANGNAEVQHVGALPARA